MPQHALNAVLLLCRDSLRAALEIVHLSIDHDGEHSPSRQAEVTRRLQETLLNAAQGQLRHYNPNLRGMLTKMRNSFKELSLPVRLRLPGKQLDLYNTGRPIWEMSRDAVFMHLAMRAGVFTTTNGVSWHPMMNHEYVEVHPLFIWREGDKWLIE